MYSKGPAAEMEMAVKYVTNMMNFFGIKDIETVVIEGHSQSSYKAEEIISAGLEEAIKLARTF